MKSEGDFKKKMSPYTNPRPEGHAFESGRSDEWGGVYSDEASLLAGSQAHSSGVGIEEGMQYLAIGGASEQAFETVDAYGDADWREDEDYGPSMDKYNRTIGFETYDQTYLGYQNDGTPLSGLPVELVQKVTDYLQVRDIIALAGVDSSWRDKVLDTRNNRSVKKIGMAQLPFLGKTIRTNHPFKLVIKNTEELEEFAKMLETDQKVHGTELKLLDILKSGSSISIENDKEYEQSEPQKVFDRVCKIILPVVRKIEKEGIGLFLSTVYIDVNFDRSVEHLKYAKIGNVILDSNSILRNSTLINKTTQEASNLFLLPNANCITTTPFVLDVPEEKGLEDIKVSAVTGMSRVLLTAIRCHPSMTELVIDPTILYRDSNGRFVDIDPKREFAIKSINDNIINANCFRMHNYDSANITILAPRAAGGMPLSTEGLASGVKSMSKDSPIELPQKCLERWKQFYNHVADVLERSAGRSTLRQVSFSGFGPKLSRPIQRRESVTRFRHEPLNLLYDGQGGYMMVD